MASNGPIKGDSEQPGHESNTDHREDNCGEHREIGGNITFELEYNHILVGKSMPEAGSLSHEGLYRTQVNFRHAKV